MAMFIYILAYFIARLGVSLVRTCFRTATVRKGGPHMITLDLRSAYAAPRTTLCATCIFSHIVTGYEPRQRIVFCGYAFPLREVPFPVKECTDFRTGRPVSMEILTLDRTRTARA